VISEGLQAEWQCSSEHSTKYNHMSYVYTEIHSRQYYCTVFTTFRCPCHWAQKWCIYLPLFVQKAQKKLCSHIQLTEQWDHNGTEHCP